MIYMCSPFTHPDPAVREQRFEAACRAAAELIRQGRTTYSPIAHTYTICRYGLPLDWRFWQRHDRRFLEVCDEVVVLMLDGWCESVGVHAEIAIARELGKPVTFLAPRPGQGKSRAGAGLGEEGEGWMELGKSPMPCCTSVLAVHRLPRSAAACLGDGVSLPDARLRFRQCRRCFRP